VRLGLRPAPTVEVIGALLGDTQMSHFHSLERECILKRYKLFSIFSQGLPSKKVILHMEHIKHVTCSHPLDKGSNRKNVTVSFSTYQICRSVQFTTIDIRISYKTGETSSRGYSPLNSTHDR
jgi:hypothetical protein